MNLFLKSNRQNSFVDRVTRQICSHYSLSLPTWYSVPGKKSYVFILV